jgi:hypothetical protein
MSVASISSADVKRHWRNDLVLLSPVLTNRPFESFKNTPLKNNSAKWFLNPA